MDTIQNILTRQSIRAFKKDPVPRELLLDIIRVAGHSPSYKNTQPWEVVVISGDKKRELSRVLLKLLEDGVETTAEFPEPTSWPARQSQRIQQLYDKRAAATGLDLKNPDIIRKSRQANFNFYHAPHAVYFFQDASLGPWSLFDIGLFVQSFMLAAHAKGVATVPQAFATDYAAQVKDFLGLPEGKRLIVGMSLGYADMDAPVNQLRTDRADVEEIVTWLE
ncbi:MAG: nitroreductase family protein [Gammaproteobacteria bacterium]|nr:nitroreductase family protein [Gammaproteobacteria bacterium]